MATMADLQSNGALLSLQSQILDHACAEWLLGPVNQAICYTSMGGREMCQVATNGTKIPENGSFCFHNKKVKFYRDESSMLFVAKMAVLVHYDNIFLYKSPEALLR